MSWSLFLLKQLDILCTLLIVVQAFLVSSCHTDIAKLNMHTVVAWYGKGIMHYSKQYVHT